MENPSIGWPTDPWARAIMLARDADELRRIAYGLLDQLNAQQRACWAAGRPDIMIPSKAD